MLTLEEIKKDATLTGIEPGQVVRVVTTEPVGDNALNVHCPSYGKAVSLRR